MSETRGYTLLMKDGPFTVENPTIDDLCVNDLIGAHLRRKDAPDGPVYQVNSVFRAKDIVTLAHDGEELFLTEAELRRDFDYARKGPLVIRDRHDAIRYASAMDARELEKAGGK